jgi:hypothetical protein
MRKVLHDKIVIGTSLNAVIYSFLNDLPLLLSHIKKPSQVEYLNPTNLPIIGELPSREIRTPDDTRIVGPSKLEVWNRLCFLMSLSGKIPFVDKISSIRINEEAKEIKVITHNSRSIIIQCNQIIIFDDTNVGGLPIPTRVTNDQDTRRVLDWISVRSGMVHPYDGIETTSSFVNCIHFYPSDRIDGNHQNRKDLVAVSYLTKEQLNDIKYSDVFVRYKVLDLMKKAGIRGRRNGRDVNNPEKYKYYAIKLEMNKREVDLVQKNLYNDTEFIKFMYDTDEDILKNASSVASSLSKLYSRLKGVL